MKAFIHRVNKNETLEYVEEKYNMPSRLILSKNNANNIYEGQWLYIESVQGFFYIVKPYEKLETISSRYNVEVSLIKYVNDIEEVFIGQKILIPLKNDVTKDK